MSRKLFIRGVGQLKSTQSWVRQSAVAQNERYIGPTKRMIGELSGRYEGGRVFDKICVGKIILPSRWRHDETKGCRTAPQSHQTHRTRLDGSSIPPANRGADDEGGICRKISPEDKNSSFDSTLKRTHVTPSKFPLYLNWFTDVFLPPFHLSNAVLS